jgi:hypothetical protein
MVEALDGSVLELKKKKRDSKQLKQRRNSKLATVSEEPGSRPLSWIAEGMERSRNVPLLASGHPGGHLSLIPPGERGSMLHPGHLSLMTTGERGSMLPPGRLSLITTGERGSMLPPEERGSMLPSGERGSMLPPGDRISFFQPGDHSSMIQPGSRSSNRSSLTSSIHASRFDALQTLSGHTSPISLVDVASPTFSMRTQPLPDVPPKSARRFSGGTEVIADTTEVMPGTSEASGSPTWTGRTQIVELGGGSRSPR